MNGTSLIEEEKTKSQSKSDLAGWIRFILLLIGVYIFFAYVIGLSIIEGESMNPTLESNGVLLITKVFNQYDRDDIVVFNSDYGFSIVKRVIGLPGDVVAIEEGAVIVNGKTLTEAYTAGIPEDMEAMQVTENSYFVLGDNRTPGESLDSRSSEVGLVNEEQLFGKVRLSLFPLKFSF